MQRYSLTRCLSNATRSRKQGTQALEGSLFRTFLAMSSQLHTTSFQTLTGAASHSHFCSVMIDSALGHPLNAAWYLDCDWVYCAAKLVCRIPKFYVWNWNLTGHVHVFRNAQASNKPICRSTGSGKSRSPRSPLSPRIAYGSASRDQRSRVTTHETVAQEKSKKRNHGLGNHGSQVDHSIFSRRVGNKSGAMTFNFNKQHHSTVQTCRGAHHMVSNRLGGKVHSLFAGPGCFQSPSPESLPMPTAVMLAKALYPLPV